SSSNSRGRGSMLVARRSLRRRRGRRGDTGRQLSRPCGARMGSGRGPHVELSDRGPGEQHEEHDDHDERGPAHGPRLTGGTTMTDAMTSADAPGTDGHPISPQEVGHVVLRVRDLARSSAFYELLGFRKVGEIGGIMAFFTATGANHHDIALQQVGAAAPAPTQNMVGLYHVA